LTFASIVFSMIQLGLKSKIEIEIKDHNSKPI
jgi:hypothetical protein